MRLGLIALALVLTGCVLPTERVTSPDPGEPAVERSPYVGQETRAIKALSAEDVQGYREGAGLGYAKSAELNHYPGPLHALQLADELGLSDAQRRDLQRVREAMLAEAVPLGEQYLAAEADIEEAFRSGQMDDATLWTLVERAHAIEAQLRFVHLDAHLATRALMTPQQVMRYDELRGYSGAGEHAHEDGHGHG